MSESEFTEFMLGPIPFVLAGLCAVGLLVIGLIVMLRQIKAGLWPPAWWQRPGQETNAARANVTATVDNAHALEARLSQTTQVLEQGKAPSMQKGGTEDKRTCDMCNQERSHLYPHSIEVAPCLKRESYSLPGSMGFTTDIHTLSHYYENERKRFDFFFCEGCMLKTDKGQLKKRAALCAAAYVAVVTIVLAFRSSEGLPPLSQDGFLWLLGLAIAAGVCACWDRFYLLFSERPEAVPVERRLGLLSSLGERLARQRMCIGRFGKMIVFDEKE